jgi:hypothetical protein
VVALVIFCLGSAPMLVRADDRKFTFVYESTTMPAGEVEYEQWVTWKTHKDNDAKFDRFEFRHELEFGVTDRFQVALYFADWRYQDGESVSNDRAEYRDSAVELVYALTNPGTDFMGSAIYGEFKGGDELMELEAKVILEKICGSWTIAYNATVAAEWEGQDYDEDTGEFQQTLGASYGVSAQWSVGAELLHEIEIADWKDPQPDVVYVGPNVAYRSKGWWATVTPLFQVSSREGEPDYQTRLLFGINF